jgi:hypothetical protein
MMPVAVLFEDDNPIRAWAGEACISKAYTWAHYHFCVQDVEPMPAHKLPDYLKVKFYIMSAEEFSKLVSDGTSK